MRQLRRCVPLAALGVAGVLALGRPVLPAEAAPVGPAAGSTRVIVLLKAAAGPLGTTPAARAARAAAVARRQQPAIDQVRGEGGRINERYSLVDGFAATVDASAVATLRARPDVAAVVPDRVSRLVRPASPQPVSPSRGRQLPVLSPDVCPADPKKPQLEPEALSLMHAASDNPSVPSAADLATGAGVTVGLIANAVDVGNPDLVRPDGSPVIVDYRDFVGTGTDVAAAASESMGDAASIAAQGRTTYDLGDLGTVPAGCTIRVRGVAPDARIVALKVTDDDFFYDSVVVEAIDYAVTVAHVDVLDESLGDNPYPDTGADPLSLANAAAVAAGVTVTAASGDSGRNSTIGPPASSRAGDTGVLSLGASTSLRLEKQTGYYRASRKVLSGDVANLTSDGFAQTGRTVDALAPGYWGWSLCTDDPTRFLDCPDLPASTKGLQTFAGTSESAPLTAGVAALVIQRFRATHHGRSPAPRLVKQILTSTADDIGAPAQEQGAGQIDALRAVRLAGAVGGGAAATVGPDLLVTPTVRTLHLRQGQPGHTTITLTNPSTAAHRVVVARRSPRLTSVTEHTATVPADGFVPVPFAVDAGTDRIAVTAALRDADGGAMELELINPDGNVANEAVSQGSTETLMLEADHPDPGSWQLFVIPFGYAGPVDASVASYRNVSTPVAHLTIRPHTHRTVTVRVPAGGAGDRAFACTVSDAGTGSLLTSVPVVVRTPVALRAGRGRFAGVLEGGTGRGGAFSTVTTVEVRVPTGAPALRVAVALDRGGQRVDGYLVSPAGDALDVRSNLAPGSADPAAAGREIDLAALRPQAGTWQVTLGLNGTARGSHPTTRFVGHVRLDRVPVQVSGLPNSSRAVLAAGVPHQVSVRVTNSSRVPHTYVVDPRLRSMSTVSLTGPTSVEVDAKTPSPSASVSVPPQTTELTSVMSAPRPLAATLTPGNFSFPDSVSDPETYGTSPAGHLRLVASSRQLQDGPWLELPVAAGPFTQTGSAAPFAVHLAVSARTRSFDPAVRSSTGDPWLAAVGAAQPVTPLLIPPGQTRDLRLTITPTATRGRTVRGTVFVLDWDARARVSGTRAGFSYRYRVG